MALENGFPSILNRNWLANNSKLAKQVIDFAVTHKISNKTDDVAIQKNYDIYNGIGKKKYGSDFVSKPYGSTRRTPFIEYMLARGKINRLKNEFLDLPLKSTVSTLNREARSEKEEEIKQVVGLSEFKNEIESVRKSGLNLFPGMDIPDKKGIKDFDPVKFRTTNEVIGQAIVNKKIHNKKFQMKLGVAFLDVALSTGGFVKLQRANDGQWDIRVIKHKDMIYYSGADDLFVDGTPLIGEVRKMYLQDIIQEFELSEDEIKEVENMAGDFENQTSSVAGKSGNDFFYTAYTVQWIAIESEITKIEDKKGSDVPYRTSISNKHYKKNKNRYEKADNVSIEVKYREVLYEGTRIGGDFYCGIQVVEDQVQTSRGGDYINAYTDYLGILVGHFDGINVAYPNMLEALDLTYNIIRFQINRELSKLKGALFTYDEAFLPKDKTSFKDMLHEVDEDSVIRTDSSDTETDTGKGPSINQIILGGYEILNALVALGNDVENSMDMIIGFNKPRMGVTNASSTATSAQSDLMMSKISTYDIFYHFNEFVSEIFYMVLQKEKISWKAGEANSEGLIYSDDEEIFIPSSIAFSDDDLGVMITDGRKEREIRERIRPSIQSDIAAGNLRSSDFVDFELTESLAKAVSVLRKGWEAVDAAKAKQTQNAQSTAIEQSKIAQEGAQAMNEDDQLHDKEMIILRGIVDERLKKVEGMIGLGSEYQKAKNQGIQSEQTAMEVQ